MESAFKLEMTVSIGYMRWSDYSQPYITLLVTLT